MLFSILIPTFKEKFLKECIDSIFNQTYEDFEIIIVNDASPYDIDSIINSYSDSRIRYYKNNKNCGAINVVDNWNRCLNFSSGKYVMCIGDDDKLMPNCLESYKKLIDANDSVKVFHCRSYIIDENSKEVCVTPSWPEFESVYANMWHRMMGLRVQFIGDFLFNRDELIKNGGFYKLPLAWASDDITVFSTIENGIKHTEDVLFCYRRTSFTISSVGSVKHKIDAICQEEEWYKKFIEDSHPNSKLDILFLRNIEKEMPHYIKKKKVETIAYQGMNGLFVSDFLYWFRVKKSVGLSFVELLYILVLALKKKFVSK